MGASSGTIDKGCTEAEDGSQAPRSMRQRPGSREPAPAGERVSKFRAHAAPHDGIGAADGPRWIRGRIQRGHLLFLKFRS
jgi:hypothetical protein